MKELKHKINNFRLDVDHLAFGIMMERDIEGLPSRPEFAYKLEALFSTIFQNFVARAICRIAGHDSEDKGYGTPETGYIHIVCNQCGQVLAHQKLY